MEYLNHVRIVKYPTQTKHYANYRCSCGNTKIVRTDHIRSGRTVSCGCAGKDNAKSHGFSGTKIYRTWTSIRNNRKAACYIGVKICDRWQSFENFREDMGEPPTSKHEIDRIDPFGNYEPSNCRWATRTEQMLNQRRNTHIYQEFLTLSPIVTYKMYRNRLRAGWDNIKAATTPKQKNQFC